MKVQMIQVQAKASASSHQPQVGARSNVCVVYDCAYSMCVCVYVCVHACVCKCERVSMYVCACACVCERESVCSCMY